MEFLRPYIVEKNLQVTNFDNEDEDFFPGEVLSNNEEQSFEIAEQEEEVVHTHDNEMETSSIGLGDSAVDLDSSDSAEPILKKPQSEKKKLGLNAGTNPSKINIWKSKKPLTPTASVMKEWVDLKKKQYEKQSVQQSQQPQKTADHLTKFFQSAEETTRTLPVALQIKVKSEINKILTNAEYESIQQPSQWQEFQQNQYHPQNQPQNYYPQNQPQNYYPQNQPQNYHPQNQPQNYDFHNNQPQNYNQCQSNTSSSHSQQQRSTDELNKQTNVNYDDSVDTFVRK